LNIFIEGPRWAGMWTEIIADALRNSGHRVEYCYHNHKTLRDRAALAAVKLRSGEDRGNAWRRRHRQQLTDKMRHTRWDILLSIQGSLDNQTATLLREISRTSSVVVVEHDMEFIRALSTRVTVLNEGSVLAEGSLETLQNNQQVIDVYLGR